MEGREFRRRLAFPCIVAMKPILPHAVEPGISGGIIAERMPPSFFICGLEDGVVDPVDEPKPKKFSLVGMRFAVGSQRGLKARTSLIDEGLHCGRDSALNSDHQTNPICKGAPLDEVRNRGGKTSGINELTFRFGLVTGSGAESNLSFAVSSSRFHRQSIRGSLPSAVFLDVAPYDTPKLVLLPARLATAKLARDLVDRVVALQDWCVTGALSTPRRNREISGARWGENRRMVSDRLWLHSTRREFLVRTAAAPVLCAATAVNEPVRILSAAPIARRPGIDGICYAQIEVRRGIHIAVSLVAVFLLLKPVDCFSGNKFTKEAADCCRKGKCRPSTGDDCCKGTLPGGKQLVTSKAQNNQIAIPLPVIEQVVVVEPVFTSPTFHQVPVPPASPPTSRLNLPLLI